MEYPSHENESDRAQETPAELVAEQLVAADMNIQDETSGNNWYEQWGKENL